MSNGGSCPNDICPAVVYVQIIYAQWWDRFNLSLYMFINEALLNPCLLNSETILKYFASSSAIIMN